MDGDKENIVSKVCDKYNKSNINTAKFYFDKNFYSKMDWDELNENQHLIICLKKDCIEQYLFEKFDCKNPPKEYKKDMNGIKKVKEINEIPKDIEKIFNSLMDWFIIKIFPNYKQDCSDVFDNVCKCGDKYLKELENIAEANKNFFLHYTDQDTPEGPHFKFFVKNPKRKQDFERWVQIHKQDDEIKDIKIHLELHDVTKQEGIIAKEIFESIKGLDRSNLKELKEILLKDKRYISLSVCHGQHYIKNMLKIPDQMFENI